MTNRNYKRGAALEYLIKGKLEKEGWFVVRAAGSHGPCDLVAMKRGQTLLISCKLSEYAPPIERDTLAQLAADIGAMPMITTRDLRNHWTLTRLDLA